LEWLIDTVIGAQFHVHSSLVPGDIHIEDTKSRSRRTFPPCGIAPRRVAFTRARTKPGYHILATVVEKDLHSRPRHHAGGDHPLIWCIAWRRARRLLALGTPEECTRAAHDQLLDNMISGVWRKAVTPVAPNRFAPSRDESSDHSRFFQ